MEMRPLGTDASHPAGPPAGGETIRAALIGCGRIAAYHVAAIQVVPGARIVGVCDLNHDAARALAARHGIEGAYRDPDAMMRETRPDVVHLLTPPQSHLALTELACAHRAHLYVEKPLAACEQDATAMIAAAGRAGVQLCPGHNRLFDPHFLDACRRIRAGEIGRVVSVRAEQGFAYERSARSASVPWSYRYDWGIFDNLMPHPLYLASHFLDRPADPHVVGFNLGRIREAGVEEIRVLIPSGSAVAEVALSLTTAPPRNYVEVIGTQGRLTADWISLSTLVLRHSPLPAFVSRFTSNARIAAQLAGATAGLAWGVASGRIKQYMGLRALVDEFYRGLRSGSAPPVTPEQGLLNVRQLDAIRRATTAAIKPRVRSGPRAPDLPEPRVLVTGGSGFLGGRVVERLAADGIPTRATTRLLSRSAARAGVEWVECDVTRDEDLRRALRGVETVYHCAAMAGPPGSLQEYEDINVRATLRLAELAAEAGVRTLVYVSSISVYEQPRGSGPYLDESAPYDRRAADRGFYTQSKLGADRALREYAATHPAPRVVLLRPGTIYGPGVKLPAGRFQFPSPARRPLVAGGRGVPMTLTYVDNVVDAMFAAGRASGPSGRVYNVIDSPDTDQGAVARALAETSGGSIRTRFVPYWVAWSLMLAADLVALVRRRRMGTARYRLQRTLADMRYPCVGARRELGWEPRVSLAEGLARVLAAETEPPFPH
jgi:predicted dehydrogenase/nucleoside-diphosphate-sugar epimerase